MRRGGLVCCCRALRTAASRLFSPSAFAVATAATAAASSRAACSAAALAALAVRISALAFASAICAASSVAEKSCARMHATRPGPCAHLERARARRMRMLRAWTADVGMGRGMDTHLRVRRLLARDGGVDGLLRLARGDRHRLQPHTHTKCRTA